MCAIGIIVPQMVWVIDFVGTAIGYPVVGMTAYMFNADELAVPARALAVPRLAAVPADLSGGKLGYDRRALLYWTVLAWVLILICFFFMPPPNPNAGLTPVNINYVWGLNDAAAQTWMPAWLWVIGMMVLMPIICSSCRCTSCSAGSCRRPRARQYHMEA